MAELIEKLGIDWKLLLAQIVNFLILLFVLKKYLYGPIIDLLSKRRKAIEEAAENSERIKRELEDLDQKRVLELEAAKRSADAILQEARSAAKEKERELLKETEQKIAKLIEEAKKRIAEEKEKSMEEVSREVKEMVLLASQKLLGEKLPSGAHERFLDEALQAAGQFEK